MSSPADLLIHYFAQAGVDTSGDCGVEIREIAEGIKEEAKAEALKEIRKEMGKNLQPEAWFGGSQ